MNIQMQALKLKQSLEKYFPFLIILGGLGLVLLSVAIDFVGLGGEPGFGRRQMQLAIIGVVVSLIGFISSPLMRRSCLLRWMMPSVTYQYPAPSLLRHFAQILLVALWFGLVMGLSDLSYLAYQKFINQEYIRFGVDLVWLAPVAGVAITGIVGLVLASISWWWSRLASFQVVFGVFAFLAIANILLAVFFNLHFIAILVLAVGIATVVTRLIRNQAPHLNGLFWRTTAGLVVVVLVLTAGFLGWAAIKERQAYADLPPWQKDKPNVVLITLDTVRADNLSLYGFAKPTSPNLEQFAQQGVTFDWAISTAPWTLPSHASMFTGHSGHELSAGWSNALDDTYPTLAEVLASNGYHTAGFSANYVYGVGEYGLGRGFIYYEDYERTLGLLVRSSSLAYYLLRENGVGRLHGGFRDIGRKDASVLNQSFLRWLDHRKEPERPFFAFLNYFDAHRPYVPPPDWALKFTGKEKPKSNWEEGVKLPPDEIKELNDAYDASIAYLDHQVGLLLDNLKQRDLLDNTLVIITSDHGEQFGEHGLMIHGNSLYLPLIHVPLVMRFPHQVPSGVRISEPVSLVNIPSTILDLVGIVSQGTIPGYSLARHWEGTSAPKNVGGNLVLAETEGQAWGELWNPTRKGDMKSLISSDLNHYVVNGDGKEELYNILDDPTEQTNLIQSKESVAQLDQFRKALDSLAPKVARR